MCREGIRCASVCNPHQDQQTDASTNVKNNDYSDIFSLNLL